MWSTPDLSLQREKYMSFLRGIPILRTLAEEELLTMADAMNSVCICALCSCLHLTLSVYALSAL